MFFLSLLEHTIRIPPQMLDVPLLEAISGELQKLFVDKVIKDLGLCVSVYDIQALRVALSLRVMAHLHTQLISGWSCSDRLLERCLLES
jgi:hypothetical protein